MDNVATIRTDGMRWSRAHRDPTTRFWALVTPDPSGCWLWSGQRYPNGYGYFRAGGKRTGAHRVAYEAVHGLIADGLHLDHLCRVVACVNPSHLEAVTQRVNTLRGTGCAARNAVKTHCNHGHEFTRENTYTSPAGRHCKTCRRAAKRTPRQLALARIVNRRQYQKRVAAARAAIESTETTH